MKNEENSFNKFSTFCNWNIFQAVSYSNLLFISGQIGINVKNNMLESGFESQARQVFQNILNIIKAKDTSLDLNSILKLTIYLKDLSDFDMLNEIMNSYLTHILQEPLLRFQDYRKMP